MRLGQLARELKVSITDVREKLVEEFKLDLTKGPNTKLEEEHIAFIQAQFKKEEEPAAVEEIEVVEDEIPEEVAAPVTPVLEDTIQFLPEEPDHIEPESAEESAIEESIEAESPVMVEPLAEQSSNNAEEVNIDELEKQIAAIPEEEYFKTIEKAEKLETQKITLAGITVVDKIDLPEPPPKKEESEDSETEENKEKKERKPQSRKRPNQNRRKKHSSNKNQEKAPEKKEKRKRTPTNKELREQESAKNYKPKAKQAKGKKKKKKATPAKTQQVQQNTPAVEEKKTGFSKFWDWLTNG